jgi:hypothetical protein
LQLYVAVEPKLVPEVVTLPFEGLGAVGQSAGLQVGAVPLQVASAWQVRGEVPASPKPVLQLYAAVEP